MQQHGFGLLNVVQSRRPVTVLDTLGAPNGFGDALQQDQKARNWDQCLKEVNLNTRRARPTDFVVEPGILGIEKAVIQQANGTWKQEQNI